MPLGDQNQPFDLIMVGRGAAAADYLLTLPRRYAKLSDDQPLPLNILVLGQKDPWSGARGYTPGAYAQYVNQSEQVLQRRTDDTAPTSQGPQDRLQFAAESERILAQVSNGNVREATVRAVSKVGAQHLAAPMLFKVETDAGIFHGHKIVFATGAGIEGDKGHKDYHMTPPEVTAQLRKDRPGAVMDLDQFIGKAANQSFGSKKVAILGPTAGTDAVMTALTLKVGAQPQNLYWLMRDRVSTTGFANVYPGQGIAQAQQKAAANIVAYKSNSLSLSNGSGDRVRVRAERIDDGKVDPLGGLAVRTMFDVEVDYFVYSIGQTAGNTMSAPPQDAMGVAQSVLQGDLGQKLEPVYDINQRVGSAPWEHVTAVQLEGSHSDEGLLIIGAATFQVASRLEHNFLQRDFDQLRDKLLNEWTALNNCAQLNYPQLLDRRPLNSMEIVSRDDCARKATALLGAWRSLMQQNLGAWQALQQLTSGGAAKAIDDACKSVKHLCYLHSQRCQAAAYLFQTDAQGVQVKDRKVQDMLKPTQTLPQSLSDCRLLAAVSANVNALNASSPQHLNKKTIDDPLGVSRIQANFLEDKTELRCYISAHYPNIPEQQAAAFITRVSTDRKGLGNMGFEKGQMLRYEADLVMLDSQARQSL